MFKKIVLEMHFLYKKFKIRKDWSLLYFVIRTDRSLPKFGKFGEIGALNSERLKHSFMVTRFITFYGSAFLIRTKTGTLCARLDL